MKDGASESGFIVKFLPYILLAMALAVVLYVRIRLLQAPLERDEGEFAYMGQLLLKGIALYTNAYTMKLPGASFMYALFMFFFGQTIAGIHLGLLIVNGLCVYLVYLLGRRVIDNDAAIFSCAVYAVLSLSQSVLGVYAHATHFVALFSMTGFVLLLRYFNKGRMVTLFCGGLCFGLAFIMKQHAVMLIVFAFLLLLRHGWKNKKELLTACSIFLSGIIVPYALVVLYVLKAGVFDKFWFWTVQYAQAYVTEITITHGWNIFTRTFVPIFKSQFPLWLLSGAGVIALYLKKDRNADRMFLFGYFFFSFLAICPGLYFRDHYFVMLLPAAALLAGAAVATVKQIPLPSKIGCFKELLPSLLLITAVAYGFYNERWYCFSLTPQQVTRAIYDRSPFPEAVEIGRYIKEHSTASDRIAVFGSEPEILFYADRLSATSHIYMYGLLENQPYAVQMQMEMMHDIETTQPKFVVMVNYQPSWGIPPFSSRTIIEWADNYVSEHYDLVGLIDIFDFYTTLYLWDDKAREHKPDSEVFVSVLKRKEKS